MNDFIRFVSHDGGRGSSKRPKQRNDCTVRALAIVADVPYDTAFEVCAAYGRSGNSRFVYPFDRQKSRMNVGSVFELGIKTFWRSFPAVKGLPRLNVETFLEQHPNGRFIMRVAKHVSAVVDGIEHDLGEYRPYRCVYGAWEVTKL